MKHRNETVDTIEKDSVGIFVVEDESIVASEIEGILKSEGYSVMGPVASGADAVDCIYKCKPDVVLMDIHLKGKMDGIEAAERITTQLPVPIVYLTAYSDPDTLERAKKTKPFGFITKPFSGQELVSTVAMALRKHVENKQSNRLKAILWTVRNIHRMLAREKRADSLIQNACRELVQTSGYSRAWIVMLDDQLRMVSMQVAGTGKPFAGYGPKMRGGEWPPCIRQVLKQKRPVAVRQAQESCFGCAASKSCENASHVLLLLKHEKILYGILGISFDKKLAMHFRETELLEGTAHDIASALHRIESENK